MSPRFIGHVPCSIRLVDILVPSMKSIPITRSDFPHSFPIINSLTRFLPLNIRRRSFARLISIGEDLSSVTVTLKCHRNTLIEYQSCFIRSTSLAVALTTSISNKLKIYEEMKYLADGRVPLTNPFSPPRSSTIYNVNRLVKLSNYKRNALTRK